MKKVIVVIGNYPSIFLPVLTMLEKEIRGKGYVVESIDLREDETPEKAVEMICEKAQQPGVEKCMAVIMERNYKRFQAMRPEGIKSINLYSALNNVAQLLDEEETVAIAVAGMIAAVTDVSVYDQVATS